MSAATAPRIALSSEEFTDNGVVSLTSIEQKRIEDIIKQACSLFEPPASEPTLFRDRHYQYLKKGLHHLSDAYECLDASRPWICYWILHGLELLDEPVPDSLASDVCAFLKLCQCADGGFGGGPGQQAHLAPTYAAVNALCILGTEESYAVIDREKLQSFLYRIKQPNGDFCMHEGGETDVRSAYCAASVASLTYIMEPKLFEGTADWVVSCQNWEGGIGGVPGMEAHGGYTFCGLAALVILRKERMLDLQRLLRWVVNRQMRFEGGFQGRTNKLVDGCYSFWQAGLLPLLHRSLMNEGDQALSEQRWMFHQEALQEYLLMCCQHVAGGLLDKPGKARDFYHTCYCLSGLSVAQHFCKDGLSKDTIVGKESNALQPTHPIYNIDPDKVARALVHFSKLGIPIRVCPADEPDKLNP
ncbi:protein farnesyltransferase subunit beta-like [Lethenteron reissneri]|uniref:protein farnesyltransferase subunit beta-like n=1 Tax=Lethenteron reissneri TaxID=7753 RepID=UPI002AB70C72|nr:protein farnesyltransferase subunit beta-like [Lethenteron reissneri]XP_061429959.1 protein farnesyltransferase subunit beta-like [Lethenteron reissneri]